MLNSLTLIEIFTILFIHWVADFIFQDEKWALGKSKNWDDLLHHTVTYSVFWILPAILMLGYDGAIFIIVTFLAHTTTDYFTSRVVSKKFANKEYGSAIPNFGAFTIIGFDQILHYIQLFLTYSILKAL